MRSGGKGEVPEKNKLGKKGASFDSIRKKGKSSGNGLAKRASRQPKCTALKSLK